MTLVDDAKNLPSAEDVRSERELRRALGTINQLRGQLKAAHRELEISEKRLEFVDAIRDQQQCRVIDKCSGSGDAIAILVLSDWHCGEKVDPAQVQRLNEYSPAIFRRRAEKVFQHAAQMLDWARHFARIDNVVVAAIGDFITGYIHEELRKSNYLSPTEETEEFQSALFSGLTFLRKTAKVKQITVITKNGNHGRTTEKNQAKDEHKNSFEHLAYRTMERYFQIPGVSWRVEPGYHTYHDIFGRPYRFHHGHAIRFKGGVGGIYVPMFQKLHHWNRTKQAYRDVMGHFHQYTPTTACVVNGSLIGYSEYSAMNGFAFEPPSQTLIIESKKRGSIVTERVFCD